MKSMRYLFHAFLLALVLAGSLHATESHMIFQTSTLQALMDGVYDGNMTFQELGRHGDSASALLMVWMAK
jgi:acetolactate decarboxylase